MRIYPVGPVKHFRVIAIAVLFVLPAALPAAATKTNKTQKGPPNFLIIMTDDQSHDTMTDQFMPYTKSMIADQGINLTRGYMSTSLCCPSRSSFLTGKYARHDGVHTNGDKLTETTVADRLQKAGYYTGLIGKYLNSWPGDARPEFDYWACWLLHKNRVYEEASHGPFALRYPPLVPTPRSDDRLIQVADLAPTMCELAGLPIPDDVDGRSLVPLMQNSVDWRDAILLEGWPGNHEQEHYQAIRTDRFVYIETDNDISELYDTKADPFQMNNLINNPDFKQKVKKLSKRLHKEQF